MIGTSLVYPSAACILYLTVLSAFPFCPPIDSFSVMFFASAPLGLNMVTLLAITSEWGF